jgi:NAD(P)-dependent dehydrogenase (short-subunit alcohol dehydrogenase family)
VVSYVAITGGASGLGRVVADRLLGRDRPVVILDRDDQGAHAAASRLTAKHGTPVPVVVADLSSVAGIRWAADELTERFDVNALVNNAGGWQPGDQYPDADSDAWLSAVTLNLLAPMLLTQSLWAPLSATSGAVVNIGSSAGVGDAPYESPEYGAAKAGVRRFTASLGSRDDVRVMAVVPGWIGLARAHREWAALTAEEQRDIGPLIPPEDIANAVVSLIDHGRPGEVVEILRAGERTSTAACYPIE